MGEWSVEVDEEKNRMIMTLSGHFTEEEARKAAEEGHEGQRRLEPGFEVINDLSEFRPGEEGVQEYIRKGKERAVENGLAATVRVVSESVTGQMQYDRAGQDAEQYQVAKAESVEQAKKLLDQRER